MAAPRRYDDELRADVLAAAAEALSRGGEASVSIRTVAAVAGTTTAGVYALFGSRDRLIAEVVASEIDGFRDRIARSPRHADPLEDFFALCHAYLALGTVAERHGHISLTDALGADAMSTAVRRLLGPDAGKQECFESAVTVYALVHGLVLFELNHVLADDPEHNARTFGRALEQLLPVANYPGGTRRAGQEDG